MDIKNIEKISAETRIIIPILLYIYPKIEIILFTSLLSFSLKGLYRAYETADDTPSSAKLKKPRMLIINEFNPTNSSPKY